MSRIRQVLVAGATFSTALGIGFVMQNGDVLAARFSGDAAMARPAETAAIPVAAPAAQPGPAALLVRERLDRGLALSAPVGITAPRAETAPVEVSLTDDALMPSVPVPELVAPAIDAVALAPAAQPEIEASPQSSAPVLEAALEPTDLAPAAQPAIAAAPQAGSPVLEAALDPADLAPSVAPLSVAPDCPTTMTATAAPAAMVDLVLLAPCAPDTRVTIHHQGMMFSVLTDPEGAARLRVPALAESAVFMADLGEADGAVAVTTVPDLGDYDRAVLQWQGLTGPEIHALEFGAAYSDEGHVWHGAARDPGAALRGDGGFLVRLGDGQGLNPLMAEVYTYPSGLGRLAGQVALSVEAPVTADNCGSRLQAQTIQVSPGAAPFAFDLDLTVPSCDAVGQYLLLHNMLLDLTLAAK
jgi:hypothetical protein